MKEIDVKMYELTLDEVHALPDDSEVVIYNTLIGRCFMVKAKRIKRNTRAHYVYLTFKDPKEVSECG